VFKCVDMTHKVVVVGTGHTTFDTGVGIDPSISLKRIRTLALVATRGCTSASVGRATRSAPAC